MYTELLLHVISHLPIPRRCHFVFTKAFRYFGVLDRPTIGVKTFGTLHENCCSLNPPPPSPWTIEILKATTTATVATTPQR